MLDDQTSIHHQQINIGQPIIQPQINKVQSPQPQQEEVTANMQKLQELRQQETNIQNQLLQRKQEYQAGNLTQMEYLNASNQASQAIFKLRQEMSQIMQQAQQQYQRQQNHDQGHQHGPNCKHKHQQNWNPFSQLPSSMRVFVWHNIFSGDYFLQFFLQLPMMGAGYQLFMQLKAYFLKPIFLGNNFINERIEKVNLPLFKEIIGGFMLIFIAVHYLVYYFILKERWNLLVDSLEFYFYIQITLFSILNWYLLSLIVPPGYLDTTKEKKRFDELLIQRPELQMMRKGRGGYCLLCQIPIVLRAKHCLYKRRCIARYETFSMILNAPLGVYNYPLYIFLQGSICLYLLLAIYSYTLPTVSKYNKSFIDLFGLMIILHQLFYFAEGWILCVIRAMYNITLMEIQMWRRYNYFWKNERGEFFNPFDKGVCLNIFSIFIPWLSKLGLKNLKNCCIEVIDWGDARLINLTDIPGHPLAGKFSEQIQKQLRMFEQYQQQESLVNQQQDLILKKNEEHQGLLEEI